MGSADGCDRATRRRLRWAPAIGLALAVAGCQAVAPSAEDAAATSTDAATTGDGQADASVSRDMAPVTDAQVAAAAPRLSDLQAHPLVDRLPVTAPAAVVFAPPASWGDTVHINTILDAADLGELVRTTTRSSTGHDLTVPPNLARLWLDPASPVAAAVLELDPLTVAFGARLLDAQALRTLLYAYFAQRHPLREVRADGATILGRVDGWGPTFGWTEDEAWIVFGRGLQRGEGFHHALKLAGGRGGLALLPEVQAAFAEMKNARDLAAIVNIPAIVERGLRDEAADPRIGSLREKEAFARRFDEFPRANRLMTDRLRRQVMDLVTRQREVAEQVLRSAFYPFGPAALGARFDDGALAVDFVQRLTAGSLAATTFRAGAAPSLDRFFDRPPVVRASVSFDPVVATLLARGLAIVANRGEIALFEAELRARTGVDLRRDLVETSDGTFELAVGIDPGRFAEPTRLFEAIHRAQVVVRWGVSDAAAVNRAFGRIERGVDWVKSAGEDRFIVELPPLPQIWIQVADDGVYASFDAAVLGRVDAEEAGAEAVDEVTPADGGVPDPTAAADAGAAGSVAGDAGLTDGGRATDGGGVTGALHAAAATTAEAADGNHALHGAEALVVDITPPGLGPVIESLVDDTGERGAGPGLDGPGSLGFERARGLAVARSVAGLRVRAVQTRDAFSLSVKLTPADDGLARSVARILRASLGSEPSESPTKGGKPDAQDAP